MNARSFYHRIVLKRIEEIQTVKGGINIAGRALGNRVEDAMRATREAVKEGIVPGGNAAWPSCTLAVDKLKLEDVS